MGILTAITFLPLIGAIIILFVPKTRTGLIQLLAMAFSLATLGLCGWLYYAFDRTTASMQFVEQCSWIPNLNVEYFLGVDGLSVPLIILTALLSLLSIVYSYSIKERVKEYFFFFLLLETGMLGVFAALDFFLFYMFWEISLVPMYFLIGIWGGPKKEYAAIKFFLYTLFGSVFMLLAILALYFKSDPHTFNMITLIGQYKNSWTFPFQMLVFLAFYLAFAIKVPIFPFHTWLPLAHVEAPTAGSVILAGILLKMGVYGLLRVNYTILPEMAVYFALPLAILALINIVYGALVAMAQQDLKKMVAYSSISHMGYCLLGMAALTTTGFNGAVFQMINHGVITGALFLLVGVIYERTHTRQLNDFGGLGARLPVYTGIMVTATLASLGLPGLAGFVSELMCLLGAFMGKTPLIQLITIIAISGIVITAAFFLWMIQKVFLGPLKETWANLTDMTARELLCLVPLVILMLLLGIFPKFAVDLMDVTMTHLANMLGNI
ncbi:MAG: NADH-quinone oxidoreductase subunit M [Elusimicrobiota bacterium]